VYADATATYAHTYTHGDANSDAYTNSHSHGNSYAHTDAWPDHTDGVRAQGAGATHSGSHLERGDLGQYRHLP